jgi:HAD superfamily hydrolase (TIGR01509 family)
MRIKAVIFDMDGLMLDTEPLYRVAWQQAAAESGYTLSDAIHSRMMGRNTADSEQVVLDEFGPEFPMDVFRARCQALETAFQESPLPKKHGLDELLDLLDSRGVSKAVATSTHRKIATPLLAATSLLSRFNVIATGDEVTNGKPAPDLFLLAAQRLGIGHAECLVLEDAEPGVIAAHGAGMQVYIVPDLQRPSAQVSQLANGTFDSLTAVARHLESTSLGSTGDHVTQTIATYNLIAPDYKLTATPEMRDWEEKSMRMFSSYLAGKRVLVPQVVVMGEIRVFCPL